MFSILPLRISTINHQSSPRYKKAPTSRKMQTPSAISSGRPIRSIGTALATRSTIACKVAGDLVVSGVSVYPWQIALILNPSFA